jgi:putative transcriptional regulator
MDMRKYKSDIYEAVHEDAMADFEVGGISEARMREYDAMCLVQEPEESYAAEPSAKLEHGQSPLALSLGS